MVLMNVYNTFFSPPFINADVHAALTRGEPISLHRPDFGKWEKICVFGIYATIDRKTLGCGEDRVPVLSIIANGLCRNFEIRLLRDAYVPDFTSTCIDASFDAELFSHDKGPVKLLEIRPSKRVKSEAL